MDQNMNFEEVMKERFAKLPVSVQNAITSADVEQHLRDLAKTHQLHVDQWSLLENEVMLTLLGLQQMSDLKNNIVKQVGVSEDVALALAADISAHVFHPIREELERQLQNPNSHTQETTDMGAVRQQGISNEKQQSPQPKQATPQSTTSPEQKAVRPETAAGYLSSTPSHERRGIEGDPYREQVS